MTTRRRPARRGLSLVEVLLALAIMLLSLAAVSQLMNIGTSRGIEARLYARGVRLSQAKMAELEAGVVPLDQPTNGTFDDPDSDWSYTIDSQPQGVPNLYTVTVKVSRDNKGKTFEVALGQLIYDPRYQGAAGAAVSGTSTTTTSTTGGN